MAEKDALGALEEARQLNVRNWDERAAVHGQDRCYDIAGFLAGASSLRPTELALCGDVVGRDLLHLQCHFGLDTLSWARLGARVTGLDFSGVAIGRAQALAEQAGLAARFIHADVADLPADLVGGFDVVVATYGVFAWIGDLQAWARTAHQTLRPGGRLVVVDMHPLVQMIEQRDPLIVDFPYADDGSHHCVSAGTYADPAAVLAAQSTVQWAHSVGEIVTALTHAGLRLDQLHEHLSSDRDDRPGVLTQGTDRRWRLQVWDHDLPVLLSLTATKT